MLSLLIRATSGAARAQGAGPAPHASLNRHRARPLCPGGQRGLTGQIRPMACAWGGACDVTVTLSGPVLSADAELLPSHIPPALEVECVGLTSHTSLVRIRVGVGGRRRDLGTHERRRLPARARISPHPAQSGAQAIQAHPK